MAANPFAGAWRLVSYESRKADGSVSYPFGEDPVGYILYTQDGYMSATIMRANRPNFSSEDSKEVTAGEKAAAFDTYISYAGRYEIMGENIIHHAEVSLIPGWTGSEQERFWHLEGDRLSLRTPPMLQGGKLRTSYLVWERAGT